MKKTLVAIAAMAAVTGAMAEVTISGQVDAGITNTITNTAGTKSTVNALTPAGMGQSGLNFGVTEDLGDGITAYAAINTIFSGTTVGSTAALFGIDNGSGVGLKGAFGDLFMGVKYNMTWWAMNAADATGWNTAPGRVYAPTLNAAQNSNMIIYTLPTIVEGMTLAAENHLAAVDGNAGGFYGWSAKYASGPLAIQYAGNRTTTNTSVENAATLADGVTSVNAGTAEDYVGDVTTQAIAVTYDLGAAKLHYGNQTLDDSGSTIAENKATYGVSIPLGAASIGYAYTTAKFTNTVVDVSIGALAECVLGKQFIAHGIFSSTIGICEFRSCVCISN